MSQSTLQQPTDSHHHQSATPSALKGSTLRPLSTPGDLLWFDFMEPLGLTKYRLAKAIGVPPQRIGQIIAGKRTITADTCLRLCRYFGLSDGYWLRVQMSHDLQDARRNIADELDRIVPIPPAQTLEDIDDED